MTSVSRVRRTDSKGQTHVFLCHLQRQRQASLPTDRLLQRKGGLVFLLIACRKDKGKHLFLSHHSLQRQHGTSTGAGMLYLLDYGAGSES